MVIPARNEAEVIGATIASLAGQEWSAPLPVILVDDQSTDATAETARSAAAASSGKISLRVVTAPSLPQGWAGKVWAMHQGITVLAGEPNPPRYVLFSDADIVHGPNTIRELVARAEDTGSEMTSLMVRLRCSSLAERLMIPAFVFFFRMLYPFRRANNPQYRLAAAAGGTMLVRWSAIERIGGMAAIQGALIDDCSLASAIKRGGHRIWIGLSAESSSTRGYGCMREVIAMVARSAYTQLGYSPMRLLGCLVGLSVVFLVPPAVLAAGGYPAIVGALAWVLMICLYLPMVRFYKQPAASALLLPVAATFYLYATLLSAGCHYRGIGGQWKGRTRSSAF